ncbi:hypothetical protein [Dyella nitratireducens]|uniref:Tse2 ADP-ribosyltransferase toxin domain-containing protein n=1 Tax=Dyella nitratireducens TaxID=1849580 RepID=A0ABQ1FJH9_9GAMM|nr:hypothetical protein [Dyella nitratireducens]GGA16400.1 hypothetical protein GCM10010981_00020 [Dyella nitratireducens]GLQ44938.1 hypothetical protein GCM10007902_47880 [Dyella nitratireducens]
MKNIEVLQDVLIETNQIERFFGGVVPVDLWRARKVSSQEGLFAPVEQEVQRMRGAPRKPDITIEDGWVRVRNFPRGISTFDKPNLFKGAWNYYKIPAGTVLPEGLVIVRDYYNSNYDATHHTIAPAYDMPLERFKALLAALAKLLEKDVSYGN